MDCGKCTKTLADKDAIKCTSCTLNMHYWCAGLSAEDFKKILPMNKIKWKCLTCKAKKQLGSGSANSPKQTIQTIEPGASILNIDNDALTEYLDCKFKVLSEQWRADIREAISDLTDTFKADVQELTSRINTCEENLQKLEQKLDSTSPPENDTSLRAENEQLRKDMEDLLEKLDDMDQSARLCNVEIQNIPERRGENLVQMASDIGRMLGVELPPEKIQAIHRTAHSVASDRPKNIVLQLTTRRLRDDVIAAARARRTLTTADLLPATSAAEVASVRRFYVNEHLTLKKKILFGKARKIAKEKEYKYIWVKNANILLRKTDDARVLHIRNDSDLMKI
ncbi:uncharacterized protein LOC134667783 [Cydia fagiglandana]|uniref:uncharacterized protein LOC134667783 n=1 Tax=Cydia fagiglandana TaxID=1458189 RepID=UPI002FEE6099